MDLAQIHEDLLERYWGFFHGHESTSETKTNLSLWNICAISSLLLIHASIMSLDIAD